MQQTTLQLHQVGVVSLYKLMHLLCNQTSYQNTDMEVLEIESLLNHKNLKFVTVIIITII